LIFLIAKRNQMIFVPLVSLHRARRDLQKILTILKAENALFEAILLKIIK